MDHLLSKGYFYLPPILYFVGLLYLHGGVGHGFIFVVRHGGASIASGPLAKSR